MSENKRCCVCRRPLVDFEQEIWEKTLKEEKVDDIALVCPTCSAFGFNPPTPVEHIHLFSDQNGN